MRHPNNGFVSYVNVLDNYYSIKPTGNFLLRFFKILPILIWRTLKDAGIELLLLLIFWAVIMKMSQGRDLIVSLFEPNGLYGKERIIFTTLAVISYSVSMWIIPAFMFELQERKARKNKYPRNPFDEHLFFIHRILPQLY